MGANLGQCMDLFIYCSYLSYPSRAQDKGTNMRSGPKSTHPDILNYPLVWCPSPSASHSFSSRLFK